MPANTSSEMIHRRGSKGERSPSGRLVVASAGSATKLVAPHSGGGVGRIPAIEKPGDRLLYPERQRSTRATGRRGAAARPRSGTGLRLGLSAPRRSNSHRLAYLRHRMESRPHHLSGRRAPFPHPAQAGAGRGWVFDHPFFILLDLAVGGDWPGAPAVQTHFPARLEVDYVRAFLPEG
jgi:hypothetical protein